MKCEGCGAELQFEESEKPGYISQKVFDDRLARGKPVLCRRCFSLKHYGKLPTVQIHSIAHLKNYLGLSKNALYVIDVSDFSGTFRKDILSLLKGHDVHFILNKLDLLPAEVTVEEVKRWAGSMIGVDKARVRPVSTLAGYGLNSLYAYLRERGESYIALGVTNVGKSSILNGLLRADEITVSRFPGTTMETTSRKLKNSAVVIHDTPGIFTSDRLGDLLDVKAQSDLLARKKLQRFTLKLHGERTVFLGGFVRLDVLNEADPVGVFHCFLPESVTVHQTNSESADEKWDVWFGELLKPPFEKFPRGEVVWKTVKFRLEAGQELSVAGLGWLSVARGPLRVAATLPESVEVTVRRALVGPNKFKE